jgi:hypothetical protein
MGVGRDWVRGVCIFVNISATSERKVSESVPMTHFTTIHCYMSTHQWHVSFVGIDFSYKL